MTAGLYTRESWDLVERVTQGNPGAMTVQTLLQWFSKWYAMMQWLEQNGHTGEKLWILYKDEFRRDDHALGRWILGQMEGLGK